MSEEVKLSKLAEALLRGFSWQNGDESIDIDEVLSVVNSHSTEDQAAALDELLIAGLVAPDRVH